MGICVALPLTLGDKLATALSRFYPQAWLREVEMRVAALLVVVVLLSDLVSVQAFVRQPSRTSRNVFWQLQSVVETATSSTSTFDLERISKLFPTAYFATTEGQPYNRPERRIPKYDAPIVVIPHFLSIEECDEIIRVGTELESQGIVSDLYLNHRLNKDVASGSASKEALELIQEQNLDEEELAADALSGFRAPLPPSVLLGGQSLTDGFPRGQPVTAPPNSIAQRFLKLLSCDERKVSFLEDQWINPNDGKIH